MGAGARQTADQWLPPGLAAAEAASPDDPDQERSDGLGDPVEPSQSSNGAERAPLAAEADASAQRAEAAERAAREAAAVADRLAGEVAVLSDQVLAQEKELAYLRQEAAAGVEPDPEPEEGPPAGTLEPELAEPEWVSPSGPGAEQDGQPEPAQPAEQKQAARPAWAISLNRVTFDQLREIGLSKNQAARLIGQREQRGGFSSPDELDDLRGLPQDTIELLKHAARG